MILFSDVTFLFLFNFLNLICCLSLSSFVVMLSASVAPKYCTRGSLEKDANAELYDTHQNMQASIKEELATVAAIAKNREGITVKYKYFS